MSPSASQVAVGEVDVGGLDSAVAVDDRTDDRVVVDPVRR